MPSSNPQPKAVADAELDLDLSNVKTALQLIPRSNYAARARLWKALAELTEARYCNHREAVPS
jgi:hypothetical protein